VSDATDGPALETLEEIERRVLWLAVRIDLAGEVAGVPAPHPK
jgi:hypothetical protein